MLVVAILVLIATIVKLYAYFTDVDSLEGKIEIKVLNAFPETNTKIENNTYTISTTNASTVKSYLRVKVFSTVELVLQNNDWTAGEDGYYYYNSVVEPGEKTKDLVLTIKNEYSKEKFNIITIQEAAKVKYEENGTPYADWEL